MGCFIYCFLGTSKDITLGPTAIMSLLVFLYTHKDPTYAVLLTFLSGCIQLAMAVLHLGFLLQFISFPVIKGFTLAASLTIGFGQVKNILGLQGIPQQFFLQVYCTFQKIGETRVADILLGLICLVLLLVLTWMKGRIPRPHRGLPIWLKLCHLIVWVTATARNALVVIVAGLVAYSFEVMGYQPFILTGRTAQGLPSLQLPPFFEETSNGTIPFTQMVQDLGAGLAVVPLMGLVESIAIAKAFASQNNYHIDPNQELLAIGLTNVAGSFISAYPVTGSFGRTSVNSQTGVCTPAGGLLTGAIVLLSLAYLTPLFYYIPNAALAAVIICAVAPMFDVSIFKALWKVKNLDLIPLCATFLLGLWEVHYGVIAGVIASGILTLYPIARPQIKVCHQKCLLVQPQSGLSFLSIEYIRNMIYEGALAGHLPCSVVLDCTLVNSIDYTAVVGIEDLLQEFHNKGVSITFSAMQAPVLQVLLSADLKGFHHFPSIAAAEAASQEEWATYNN
ncbi:sodium-independent sulfate anion transporter isoform X2 [Lissotriton helveticus]